MPKSEVINVVNLVAGYKNKIVWQNGNFTVDPGEFVGLLGSNGAGKTTLFKLLLGLERPISGEILIFGDKPKKANYKIGYVSQQHYVDSETRINAIEYVRLGLYGTKWGFSSPIKAEEEISLSLKSLKKVDAESLAYRPLSELSGGEVQRVLLAQSLVSEPDLLLLDEPLANLDIKREIQLIQLVKKVAKENNVAVLLIAHDINPLLPVVDKIIYIANGKVATGKPEEIVTSKKLSELYNAPIEVLKDSKGRLAVLGVEEAIHHDDV